MLNNRIFLLPQKLQPIYSHHILIGFTKFTYYPLFFTRGSKCKSFSFLPNNFLYKMMAIAQQVIDTAFQPAACFFVLLLIIGRERKHGQERELRMKTCWTLARSRQIYRHLLWRALWDTPDGFPFTIDI